MRALVPLLLTLLALSGCTAEPREYESPFARSLSVPDSQPERKDPPRRPIQPR